MRPEMREEAGDWGMGGLGRVEEEGEEEGEAERREEEEGVACKVERLDDVRPIDRALVLSEQGARGNKLAQPCEQRCGQGR